MRHGLLVAMMATALLVAPAAAAEIETSNTLAWLVFARIADSISVLGIVLTLIGLALTYKNVQRTATAAEEAKKAVDRVRRSIGLVDSASNFSSAIERFETIKALHREEAWTQLPDKYSTLKRILIALKAQNPQLSESQQALLLGAISQLSVMEETGEKIFKRLRDGGAAADEDPDIVRLNGILSELIQGIYEISLFIRAEAER